LSRHDLRGPIQRDDLIDHLSPFSFAVLLCEAPGIVSRLRSNDRNPAESRRLGSLHQPKETDCASQDDQRNQEFPHVFLSGQPCPRDLNSTHKRGTPSFPGVPPKRLTKMQIAFSSQLYSLPAHNILGR